MPLCTLCKGISVSKLVPFSQIGQEDDITWGYQHQPTLDALEYSANECSLCFVLLTSLRKCWSGQAVDAGFSKGKESGISLMSGGELCYNMRDPKRLSHIRVSCGNGNMDSVDLALYARADDPLALYEDVVGRFPNQRADDQAVLELMTQWYSQCLQNHPQCRAKEKGKRFATLASGMPARIVGGVLLEDVELPARLVRIDDQDRLSLWESQGGMGAYVALSYSWGSKVDCPPFDTRRGTFASRISGFSKAQLPKTLQDAISVTQILGFKLIWIDALCIVQDDKRDWQHECANIAAIYNNASVTIAASAAKHKASGIFVKRPQHLMEPIEIPSKCSDGTDNGSMFAVQRSGRRGEVANLLDRSVLGTRAWCLQERIFSRRLVHFGEDQLFWECQVQTLAEDGSLFDNTNRLKRVLYFDNLDSQQPTASLVLRGWHQVIADYTQRELFSRADMLPAISGLASEVAKLLNDDYLAGIWRIDLPLGLLWVATRSGKARRSARIPSWSRVSMDGPVNSGYRAPALILQSVKVTLEVLEIHVDIPGIDPFGEVRTAYLKGRGRMHKAFRGAEKIGKNNEAWPYATGGMPLLDSEGIDIGEVLFDDIRLDQAPLSFDCLESAMESQDTPMPRDIISWSSPRQSALENTSVLALDVLLQSAGTFSIKTSFSPSALFDFRSRSNARDVIMLESRLLRYRNCIVSRSLDMSNLLSRMIPDLEVGHNFVVTTFLEPPRATPGHTPAHLQPAKTYAHVPIGLGGAFHVGPSTQVYYLAAQASVSNTRQHTSHA